MSKNKEVPAEEPVAEAAEPAVENEAAEVIEDPAADLQAKLVESNGALAE